jgi:hypothetical protein
MGFANAQGPMGARIIVNSFSLLSTAVDCSDGAFEAVVNGEAEAVQCFESSLSFERLKEIISADIRQTESWGIVSKMGWEDPDDGLNSIYFENTDGSAGQITLYPQGQGRVYIEAFDY